MRCPWRMMVVSLIAIAITAMLAGIVVTAQPSHTLVQQATAATRRPPLPVSTSSADSASTPTLPPHRTVAPTAAPTATDGGPAAVGERALALVSYPWEQRLNVSAAFTGPTRPGYFAASARAGPHAWAVTVYIRPGESLKVIALSFAHEIGHILDVERLTDADRAAWLQLRGRPGAPWWTCFQCADYTVGTGDFAETFAADQVGWIDDRSRLAPIPSPDDLARLRQYFK